MTEAGEPSGAWSDVAPSEVELDTELARARREGGISVLSEGGGALLLLRLCLLGPRIFRSGAYSH